MSNVDGFANGDDDFYLPPGFRFHPTDEELITHYLSNKVLDTNFDSKAISEADLNKSEPWDLPCKAKMGEKEWYFFCVRDRKYPTGLRTNRATNEGYWKATGKDKEIFQAKSLVGMKKTLVFYKGRAPKGVKSNWVMHEYRLEGKKSRNNFPKTAKNEWVLCRIFHKKSGKKDLDSTLGRMNSLKNDLTSSFLPSLMDSPYNSFRTIDVEPNHVTCFSDENNRPRLREEAFNSSNIQTSTNPRNPSHLSQTSLLLQRLSLPFSLINSQSPSNMTSNMVGCNPLIMQDQAFLRSLMEARGFSTKPNCKSETNITGSSQETRLSNDLNPETYSNFANYDNSMTYGGTSTSTGPVDLDCLWNY